MSHYDFNHSSPIYTCLKCNLTVDNHDHFINHFDQCLKISTLDICDFCPHMFDVEKPMEKFNHIKTHLMNSENLDNTSQSKNAITGINISG